MLSSLLLTVGILSAQTVPVLISGTVSDVSGNAIENLPVDIYSDSTFSFSYNNQVLTDANGFYADTIFYPLDLGFGIFLISATDCDGSQIGELVLFETFEPVAQQVDLVYCDTTGGWPPIDSCFVQVVCSPDGALYAEAFGNGPLSFEWNTGETTEIIVPQDEGVFCVIVTDANGCSSEGCLEYSEDEPCGPILFDSCYAAVSLDRGNILTANSYGEAPFKYLWNNGETSQEITIQNSGEYCVTITDSEGCVAVGCYFYFGGGWPPIDSCFAQVTCDPDGNLVADAFGTAPYSYVWNTGETTQIIMPQDTGLFCVTITDADGCVAEGCSHYVGGPGNFDSCIAFIIPDLTGLLIADAIGLGPFNYMWSTGETTQMISPQVEGTYCVIIESSDGCLSETCYYYVPNGGWNDTCGVFVSCDPDGNLVADAFGEAPFTYLWNTGETTEVIMPQDTGIYCVTITDADGCSSEGCSHYVGTGPGGPGWPIDSLCDGFVFEGIDSLGGRMLFALALGNPPFTYQWNNGATTESISVNDPESYCVTITDASDCVVTVCSDDVPNPVSSNIVSGYILLVDSSQFFGFLTGTVDLIDTETGNTVLTTDVANLDGFPVYNFEDVPDGDYIIRAEVTDVNGNEYLPTYHFGTTLSSEAEVVSVPYTAQGGWTSFDIVILGEIDRPGKGWITGNVTKEPGFNGGDIRRSTLNDISILLFDENHEPLQHVYTNDSGNFIFSDLAYGTYHVYIDMPGHENHYYTVVLSPDEPGFDGLHFNINETGITVNGPLSGANNIEFVSEFKLAPNPTSELTNVIISSDRTGAAILELTDISGKKLSSQTLRLDGQKQSVEMRLNNLTSGIYLVRLITGNQAAVEKLIVK